MNKNKKGLTPLEIDSSNGVEISSFKNVKNSKSLTGFTLLELLIVIAVIAILSVVLVIILDPVETLKKSRDTQRISDLSTLKTALGIYLTSTSTPYLAGATSNAACKTNSGWASGDKIFYSLSSGSAITDTTLDGGSLSVPAAGQVAEASLPLVDGNGWIPVNLDSLIGGSPISNLPQDPINTVSNLANVANTDLVYRYACNADTKKFEINAVLESSTFVEAEAKMSKDGGNNSNYYEVGTDLKILGTGTDF